MPACPACGSQQAPDARYCSNCGTALQEGGPRPVGLDEQPERRVVTVLFADLAGSTALGEQLDPEDVRVLQAELYSLLNRQVDRFGGTTEKFVGDAILAVFGIPQAHEDDPERAVRTALGARESFDAFAESVQRRHGAQVGLRVGVNTGDVVSSREAAARGELMVSGDAVNVAARLQQAAQPGEILVGWRTHAATTRTVSYERGPDLDAKGKSAPVRAWAVQSADAEPGDRALEGPFIGREDELTVLEAVASRVQREHVPQLVTLFGPAGVGKSRLVSELLARVPRARVLRGRCLPYGEGITYWPLAEAAKADAQVLETDSAEVALEKLREAVESVVDEGAGEVLDAIAWTIGFSIPESSLSSTEPQAVGARLADGWQRYVRALGGRTMTVVAIEDVHWASGALLDLVEHLVEMISDACVLLVCTARPEFLEERPTWGAGMQNVTSLSLTPLSPEESEELVSLLLGAARVPEGVRKPLLSSAEGNPFFLEEMLQMLIDEGALERQNGGWAATRRLAEIRIPDSVHGVIAARLDLLDADAREALRRCAVVGRVFWPSAVGVDEGLVASLARTGLVSVHPLSVMAGLREFSFKHALTRDVAYASLPRPERRELHRRVAEWIQSVAPDRDVETAELAAYHYREAIAYGEDNPEVLRRAYSVLLGAGEAATRRAALGAAREHLEHALPLATDADEQAAVLVALAEASATAGRWDDARTWLDQADELEGVDDLLRSAALGWRSRISWLTGRWDEALAAANGAVAALDGHPESVQLARALARRSQIEMLRNRPEAVEHSREVVAVAERVGDAFAEVNGRINLFTVLASGFGEPPDPDEVLAIIEQASAVGAHEEAARAVVNFVWSALGFIPLERIEATAVAGLDGQTPPPSIDSYLELSLIAKVLIPAGRWEEADAMLAPLAGLSLTATSTLVLKPSVGTLALRRGDLEAAGAWLGDLPSLALGSGEAQRIVPMGCAVFPWLYLSGQADELSEAWQELLDAIGDQWPVVLTTDAIARTLAAAGEVEPLRELAESLAEAMGPKVGRLGNNLAVARGLLDLAEGRAAAAAETLGEAVAFEEELGFAFDAACLKLDLAQALERTGDRDGAVRVRGEAERFLADLHCLNPF